MTDEEKIARAVQAYQADYSTLTQRERAERETHIWDLVPRRLRGQQAREGRGAWLEANLAKLCGSSTDLSCRARIWCAGGDALPVWVEIDAHGMPISTGARIVSAARKRAAAKGQMTLREAVEKEISEWRKLPATKTNDGRVIRRASPMQRVRQNVERGGSGTGRIRSGRKLSERMFWLKMRELIAGYLAMRTTGVKLEDIERDRLWQELERDMRTMVMHWNSRLQRLKEGARTPTTRRQLAAACLTLHIDPPDWGKPIDLVTARRQQRALARTYHPDRRAGDESMRARYQAVIDAFTVCEEYSGQFGALDKSKPVAAAAPMPSTAPSLRVVPGGKSRPQTLPDETEDDDPGLDAVVNGDDEENP